MPELRRHPDRSEMRLDLQPVARGRCGTTSTSRPGGCASGPATRCGTATSSSASSATRGTSWCRSTGGAPGDMDDPPDFETFVRTTPGPQRVAAVHDRRRGRGRLRRPLREPRGRPAPRARPHRHRRPGRAAERLKGGLRRDGDDVLTRRSTSGSPSTSPTRSPGSATATASTSDHVGPRGADASGGRRRSRILPTFSLASIARWASAMSSSGNRRSMTGRSSPASNSGRISAAKRRVMAIFSSSGRARSTVPMSAGPLGHELADVDRRPRRRPWCRPARCGPGPPARRCCARRSRHRSRRAPRRPPPRR